MKNKCGYNKKQLQLIREFIKDINNEIVLRISPAKEFCCNIPEYKLYLGTKKMGYQSVLWENWYRQQKFYCGKVNNRLIALLHEIGHFETFDTTEWVLRNAKVDDLTYQFYDNKMSFEDLNFAYWNLENEYKATEWAINYYKNNKEKCDLLAQQIGFNIIIRKEGEK